LLAALHEEAFALLQLDLKQVALPQGTLCFAAGDPIDQIYFPHTGLISLVVATGDGDVVEISSVGVEGAVGVQRGLGTRRSFIRAAVQIAGKFSVISGVRFEQAVSQSPALHDMIGAYTELQWAEAQQNTACNAIHDGASRLCRWLLQCADRSASEQLLLTQEFLADMLGVRRTTVTLLAQELQKKGILRYSRGRITIVDRAALEAGACECYRTTRHDNLPGRIGVKL
jgi:CRP-like cAMP-binding protein